MLQVIWKWYLPRTADGFKWEALSLSLESWWWEGNWSYFCVKALARISKWRIWTLENIDFKMYNAPYISELDNEPNLCSWQTHSLRRLLCEQRVRITFKLNGNKGCNFLNFDQRVSEVNDAFKCEIILDCIWSRICFSTLATDGFWFCYLQCLHTTGLYNGKEKIFLWECEHRPPSQLTAIALNVYLLIITSTVSGEWESLKLSFALNLGCQTITKCI